MRSSPRLIHGQKGAPTSADKEKLVIPGIGISKHTSNSSPNRDSHGLRRRSTLRHISNPEGAPMKKPRATLSRTNPEPLDLSNLVPKLQRRASERISSPLSEALTLGNQWSLFPISTSENSSSIPEGSPNTDSSDNESEIGPWTSEYTMEKLGLGKQERATRMPVPITYACTHCRKIITEEWCGGMDMTTKRLSSLTTSMDGFQLATCLNCWTGILFSSEPTTATNSSYQRPFGSPATPPQ